MAGEPFSPCSGTTIPANNTAGIFREAMKLPVKNEKLMVQVFFLVLSPFSLLVLLHYLLAGPLMQKVEDTYETSTLDPKDTRALIAIEIPFVISFIFVSLFGISITIYSSALIYRGKTSSLMELVSWIVSIWKKPVITLIHVLILIIGYIVVSLISIKLTGLIGSYICNWVLGLVVASIYLYLASVSILGFVISIVEDDCFGSGRKIQGSSIVLILTLLSIPIYVMFHVTTTDDDDELGPVARFAFMFIATVLFCISNLFNFMVFTVFQFECKRSHGESLSLETEKIGPGYVLVSTVTDP
ncbi:hypothetical protein CsSME_00051866 [Camellia sinensis var. sinensis]